MQKKKKKGIIEITFAELPSGYINEHWGAKHKIHAGIVYDFE